MARRSVGGFGSEITETNMTLISAAKLESAITFAGMLHAYKLHSKSSHISFAYFSIIIPLQFSPKVFSYFPKILRIFCRSVSVTFSLNSHPSLIFF